jgi:hypothetical protein
MPQVLPAQRAINNDNLFNSEQHRDALRALAQWRVPHGSAVNFRLMIGRAAQRDRHPFVVDLMVPPTLAALTEFFTAYQELQSSGYVVCVNEYPVDGFRFFLDLDFGERRPPDNDSQLIHALVYLFEFSTARTIQLLKVNDFEQPGYHVIVPDLVVTGRQMVARIARARSRAEDNAFYSGLMKAVDPLPYTLGSPHLRGPGCFKLWPNRLIAEAEARRYVLAGSWYFDEGNQEWASTAFAVDFDPQPADYADCFISELLDADGVQADNSEWRCDGYGPIRCPVSYGPGIFDMDWRDCNTLDFAKVEEIVDGLDQGVCEEEAVHEVIAKVVDYINTCAVKITGNTNQVIWKNFPTVIEQGRDSVSVSGHMMAQFSSHREFMDGFSHFKHTFNVALPERNPRNPNKVKQIVCQWPKIWLNHPRVRWYHGVQQRSAPLVGIATGRHFNTWTGGGIYFEDAMKFVYADTPKAIAAVTFFRDFLREVICGDPDESPLYNRYFYYAMVHFFINEVKYPHKRFLWMLFLWSRQQGVGKGRLHEILTAVVGSSNVYSTVGLQKVGGRFNAYATKNTLCLIDEQDAESLSPQERKEIQANFKKMITDSKLIVEEKYARPETISLSTSFLVTSNLPMPIPIENRRELAAYVNPCRLGDTEYWAKFSQVLIEEEGWKAVAAWIFGLDFSANYRQGTTAVIGRARLRCSQGTSSNAFEAFLATWFRADRSHRSTETETRFLPDSGTWESPMIVDAEAEAQQDEEELPEDSGEVGLAGDFSPMQAYVQAKTLERPLGCRFDHCNPLTNWWIVHKRGYVISVDSLVERLTAFDPNFRKGDLNKVVSDALDNCAFICANGVFELEFPAEQEEEFWRWTCEYLWNCAPQVSEQEVRSAAGYGLTRRVDASNGRVTLVQRGIYHGDGVLCNDTFVVLKDKSSLKAAFNSISGYQRTVEQEIPDLGIDDEYYLTAWPRLGRFNA